MPNVIVKSISFQNYKILSKNKICINYKIKLKLIIVKFVTKTFSITLFQLTYYNIIALLI